MAVEFTLPDIGEGLAEAEIVRWLVDEGDQVEEDQAIVEVETDKAVVEIPAPMRGVLQRQGAPAGTVLPIGSLLAVFDDGDGAAESDTGEPPQDVTDDETPTDEPPQEPSPSRAVPAAERSASPGRVLATPATRGLARELGVDITTVTGSGPGGRIVDEDVRVAQEDAPQPQRGDESDDETPVASGTDPAGPPTDTESPTDPEPPQSPRETRREPMRGLRRTTAQRMTTSWREVPHVTSMQEVDLHALRELRSDLADAGTRIPLTAFLVKATALALREWPSLNATVDGEDIVFHGDINLAVAVDTDDGLLVPVIQAADATPIARVGAQIAEHVNKAQARRLSPEDLRGATFTVNNYGPLGGWFGTSLVSPGQVGILSLGVARDRVVPIGDEIAVRPVAVLTLAADHRVADGPRNHRLLFGGA